MQRNFLRASRPSAREALSRTPERVLGAQEGLVVIDEIQRLPALFEVLRPLCDARIGAPGS